MAQQCSLSACSPPFWSFSPLFHWFGFFFFSLKTSCLIYKFSLQYCSILLNIPVLFLLTFEDLSPRSACMGVLWGALWSWGGNSLHVYSCLQVFSPVDPGSTFHLPASWQVTDHQPPSLFGGCSGGRAAGASVSRVMLCAGRAAAKR